MSDRIDLNQYDLWTTNTQDSVRIYTADSGDYAFIRFLKTAPNGKMYGSTWNGGFYFWHTIHQPNELGLACNFEYGEYSTLTANSVNLPNMPNYKLGALTGSGCDTLATDIVAINNTIQLRLQPNPANEYVYTEMPMQGNYYITLLDMEGRLLQQQETKQVSIFNTEHLAIGTYLMQVRNKADNYLITERKLIVQH